MFHYHYPLYNSVELDLSVRKLLTQLAYDRHETPGYYGTPHGGGHSGVDGCRFAASRKCAARFPSVTEKDAMFLNVYGLHTLDFGLLIRKIACGKMALYQPQIGREEKQ